VHLHCFPIVFFVVTMYRFSKRYDPVISSLELLEPVKKFNSIVDGMKSEVWVIFTV